MTLFPGIDENYQWVPAVPDSRLVECEECHEEFPVSDLNKQSGMCDDCHDKNHETCDDCGEDVHVDDVRSHGHDSYCDSCYTARCRCDDCSRVVPDMDDLEYDDSGNNLCEKCRFQTLSAWPRRGIVMSNQGCEVPLWDVEKTIRDLLNVMRRCRNKEESWTPKTTMVWGDYEIGEITPEGVLKIGCHRFNIEEIERFIEEEL